ncbi:hypothetical protein D3C81_2080480 [compost metagenome]
MGRPIFGPVSASTSSKLKPRRAVWCMAARMENTPMRLATKLGVSSARTTPLPNVDVSQVSSWSSTAGCVWDVAMISTSRM